MAERKGYDNVEYDSGYEKTQHKRRDCIRGYKYPDSYYEHDGALSMSSGYEPEDGFVERNNVRERL